MGAPEPGASGEILSEFGWVDEDACPRCCECQSQEELGLIRTASLKWGAEEEEEAGRKRGGGRGKK